MSVSPPITWFGGKAKLASRIVGHFPPHHTYVEPFGGSAAVLLSKLPAKVEVYNDIDQDLGNLFRVIREPEQFARLRSVCEATLYSRAEFYIAQQPSEDPVEAARRFIVRQRQSHSGIGKCWSYCVEDSRCGMSSAVRRWLSGVERLGDIHQRMRRVQIESDDWSVVMARYDGLRTLFYLDPPYALDTRVGGGYKHELTAADQIRLVESVLAVRGMVALSGYRNADHEPLEATGWQRVDYDVPAYTSPSRERRSESLWLSPSLLAARNPPLQRLIGKEGGRASMRGGAYHTHRVRSESTATKVREAISVLRWGGRRITISAVAETLGMSREHLGRRYHYLFTEM
ncbi:MAG: DNA adenine methylase [Sulfuritalea sp.]|jgi:DNA adenine methylase|nr:DNA adenine methylase [Sulfuritalea sp.]